MELDEAVRICVAISELNCVPVGFEALNTMILRGRFWNDAKEDVIFHEGIHRCSVTREVVNQNSKISVGKGWMRLDQGVKLAAVGFSLQLQQDVFLVFEEGVDNILAVLSCGEAIQNIYLSVSDVCTCPQCTGRLFLILPGYFSCRRFEYPEKTAEPNNALRVLLRHGELRPPQKEKQILLKQNRKEYDLQRQRHCNTAMDNPTLNLNTLQIEFPSIYREALLKRHFK